MKEVRKSFVVYRSYVEAIQTMEPVDQVKMWNAIADFALDDKEPELSGALKGFWLLIRPGIDSNIKKYEGGRKGKEDGKKGGRPPKTPRDDNDNVNDNVNENVNDNVNGKNNPIETPSKPLHPDFLNKNNFSDLFSDWKNHFESRARTELTQVILKHQSDDLFTKSNGDLNTAAAIIRQAIQTGNTAFITLQKKSPNGKTAKLATGAEIAADTIGTTR